MLSEAQTELTAVPAGRHRDALENLVTTLDGMFSQYNPQTGK